MISIPTGIEKYGITVAIRGFGNLYPGPNQLLFTCIEGFIPTLGLHSLQGVLQLNKESIGLLRQVLLILCTRNFEDGRDFNFTCIPARHFTFSTSAGQ